MNGIKLAASVLFLAATVSSSIASENANGIITKDVLTTGSYCHLKFPAIDESTLSSAHPVLKDASSGDIVDFYGSCDHDPLGKDEIWRQRWQRFEWEYES